ncbi:MAG TPA: sigma-70 family RNA polymerase sigma factor [Actinomycetota bacterium]|jgi:RNA polymerase sigma-70 factor (ECF subfamily)|nr:sigma-70 family RNA polymerase sigma factor [Actinomycetota bacterium]
MPFGERYETVLAGARAGAEWAWAEIYRDLSPDVLGYLRGRGAAEPEDLLGQVFLDVVRGLGRFEGTERDLRSWIFTIAHHDLLDERRRRRRHPVEPAPTEGIPDRRPGGDVEVEALGVLGAGRVRRVLERLSPDQRDVLALRIFGDLTIEQVARVIGKSPGAVKALQRRGLARASKVLTREGVPL